MASSHLIEKRRELIQGAESKHFEQFHKNKKEMEDLIKQIQLYVDRYNTDNSFKQMSKEEVKEKVKELQNKLKKAALSYDDYLQLADKAYWAYEKLYELECQTIMDEVDKWMKPELIQWLIQDFEQWKKVSFIEGGDLFSRRSWNFNVMPGHIETTTGSGNMFLFATCKIPGFKSIGEQAGAAIALADCVQEILQKKLPLYQVTYMQNDNHIYFNL